MDLIKAKSVVVEILQNALGRFSQELVGENEETLDRVVRTYRDVISRKSWKESQKWCKWNDEGPVLMPDQTRLYYRKGTTEVLVLELPPQIRLLKFKGSLVYRNGTQDEIEQNKHEEVIHYSLALPYTVFIFKFVEGYFSEVKLAFSDRPLKKLEEKPLKPYLSNIDNNLTVCLGKSFMREELIAGNVTQQVAYVLSHFWQTVYTDEWSQMFWNYKRYFLEQDKRMASFSSWEESSIANPLFVIEDIPWMPAFEESFGDIVVQMFDDDEVDGQLKESIYTIMSEFLKSLTDSMFENIESVKNKVVDSVADQMTELLTQKLK